MSRHIHVHVFLLFCVLSGNRQFSAFALHATQPADSVGMEYRSGVRFLVHEVTQGETLYSLSRRYGVGVDEIRSSNPGLDQSLRIGSRILIPRGAAQSTVSPGERYHTVQTSETLYSISRTYGVSLDNLRTWNNLAGDNLQIGMRLLVGRGQVSPSVAAPAVKIHVVEAGQTLFSVSRIYGVSPTDLRGWNNLADDNLRVGQELAVSPPARSGLPPAPEPYPVEAPSNSMLPAGAIAGTPPEERPKPADVDPVIVREAPKSDKVTEKGLAEVIDDDIDTRKYLAMHRTAPVGTIMQVRNEMNNQIVFVRVVGAIPDAGDNRRILVRISRKAYERLGAVDPRFPVEISYIP